jgi:peptidoglycan/LPS O-acetylase OafA/YrhL
MASVCAAIEVDKTGAGSPSHIFERLDTLRGLAALVVVWAHLTPATKPFQPALAGISVDLFFAISGFVIASSYKHRFESGWSVARFLMVRMIRLYPMYAIGVVVSIAIFLCFPVARDSRQALVQIAMLPDPKSLSLYPLNGPAWSLMYEMIINVFYASTFRLWTIRNTTIAMAISGSALIFLVASGNSLDGGWNWNDKWIGLSRVTYCFCAGVLLFLVYERDRFFYPLPLAMVIVVAIGPTLLPISLPELFWRLPIVMLIVPCAVASAVASSGMKPSFLSQCLGRLSYPIYALHYPLIFAATLMFPIWHLEQPLIFAASFLFFMTLLSLCLEAMIDRPLRGYLTRLVRPSGTLKGSVHSKGV